MKVLDNLEKKRHLEGTDTFIVPKYAYKFKDIDGVEYESFDPNEAMTTLWQKAAAYGEESRYATCLGVMQSWVSDLLRLYVNPINSIIDKELEDAPTIKDIDYEEYQEYVSNLYQIKDIIDAQQYQVRSLMSRAHAYFVVPVSDLDVHTLMEQLADSMQMLMIDCMDHGSYLVAASLAYDVARAKAESDDKEYIGYRSSMLLLKPYMMSVNETIDAALDISLLNTFGNAITKAYSYALQQNAKEYGIDTGDNVLYVPSKIFDRAVKAAYQLRDAYIDLQRFMDDNPECELDDATLASMVTNSWANTLEYISKVIRQMMANGEEQMKRRAAQEQEDSEDE